MPAQPNNTGLEYARYLHDYLPTQGWSGGGDAGFTQSAVTPMSEEEWNAIPSAQRYAMLSNPQSAAPDSVAPRTFSSDDNADDTARFRARFGAETYGAQSGYDDDLHRGRVIWGYGPLPTMFDANANTWMIDPSRVMVDPDGRWHYEATNIKGDWLAEQNKNADRTFQRHIWQNVGHLALAAAGGAYGAETGGGTVASTDAAESGGTLALNTAGTGTTPYIPVDPSGASTIATTPNPTGPTTPAPNPTPAPTPAPGPEFTPNPPPDTTLPPGTQPPAPVTTGATPQPGTGLINSVRNGPVGQAWDWYRGLSPTARFVVNQGLSTAGNAAMGALRQRSAQQAANEQEQRTRADTIRRGQIPAIGPTAFTPIPGAGIINGARGGK